MFERDIRDDRCDEHAEGVCVNRVGIQMLVNSHISRAQGHHNAHMTIAKHDSRACFPESENDVLVTQKSIGDCRTFAGISWKR
jgi:hypothetical protein